MANVLLIEDNDCNRDLITRYLDLLGCSVKAMSDGPTGLDWVWSHGNEIDVVLMDMNLPIVDGWELSRRLKADVRTRTLPIIAITAHAMVGDRERALAAGCDEYVTKPINFEELLQKIEHLAGKACTT